MESLDLWGCFCIAWCVGMAFVNNAQFEVVEGYWFNWYVTFPNRDEKRYTWPLGGWTNEGIGRFMTILGGWISLVLILLFDGRYSNLSRFLPWSKEWTAPVSRGEIALSLSLILFVFGRLLWFAMTAGALFAGIIVAFAIMIMKA